MNGTLILAGKLAGTAALATGALVTGVTATHSASPPSADTASTTKTTHCGRGFAHASTELKSDLKAARAKPAGKERREALRAIRKDARKGQYGDATQVASLRREVKQLRFRAQAPDALKSDLKAARAKPAGEERKAALKQVRENAVSGTYGDRVEKISKKRAEHQQTCATQRQERKQNKQSSSSPSPSTSEDSTS